MEIHPQTNTVRIGVKTFKAMGEPRRLITPLHSDQNNHSTPRPHNVSGVRDITTNTLSVFGPCQTDKIPQIIPQKNVMDGWIVVKATVKGNHIIPDRTAVHIPVTIPNVPKGCDVCMEGPSRVHKLAVEPTLNRVHTENQATVFAVNIVFDGS